MENSRRIYRFPYSQDYNALQSNFHAREFRGIAEGSGRSYTNTSYRVQQRGEVQDNPNRRVFNREDVNPGCLRGEVNRLFPEARSPAPPPFPSDSGKPFPEF
jgi:hypothetical protein